MIRKGKLQGMSTNFEIKSKSKAHKALTQMLIQSYQKCIELLRKRQERFLLIQSLHEIGNIFYTDDQHREAEIHWNDCIDTIFQQLYVLNSYRDVFEKNPNIASTFGAEQCLIGAVVLSKLAKLCYASNLEKQRECVSMAALLVEAPFKLQFPHP